MISSSSVDFKMVMSAYCKQQIVQLYFERRVSYGNVAKASSESPRVHLEPLCKGFRVSDPQRNVMGQSTERSPLFLCFFGHS